MKANGILGWLLGLLTMWSTTLAAQGSDQQNLKLPVRTFMGLDGKKHTLSGLANGKPVLLVYVDQDSDMKRGARDMNRLAEQLKGKVLVMGLHPEVLADTRKFVRKYGVRFPVLCNPEWAGPPVSNWLGPLGDRYGCNVLTIALVWPDGRVLSRSGGYSRTTLQGMFQKLRQAGGANINISLRSYPKVPVCGHGVIYGLTPPSP